VHRCCPICTKFGLCQHSSIECSSVKHRNIRYYLWTEGRTEKRAENFAKNTSLYSCVASMPVNGSQIDVCICIFVFAYLHCVCLCVCVCVCVCVVMRLFTQCGLKDLGPIFLKIEDT
jgi:hypothetical protein